MSGMRYLPAEKNLNSLLGSDLFTGNIIAFKIYRLIYWTVCPLAYDYSVVGAGQGDMLFIYRALAYFLVCHFISCCPNRSILALCGAGQINGCCLTRHWPIRWFIVLRGTGLNNDWFLYRYYRMFCLSFVLLVYMFCSCLSRLCYQVILGKVFKNFVQSTFMRWS